jgi:hypothetical protein
MMQRQRVFRENTVAKNETMDMGIKKALKTAPFNY